LHRHAAFPPVASFPSAEADKYFTEPGVNRAGLFCEMGLFLVPTVSSPTISFAFSFQQPPSAPSCVSASSSNVAPSQSEPPSPTSFHPAKLTSLTCRPRHSPSSRLFERAICGSLPPWSMHAFQITSLILKFFPLFPIFFDAFLPCRPQASYFLFFPLWSRKSRPPKSRAPRIFSSGQVPLLATTLSFALAPKVEYPSLLRDVTSLRPFDVALDERF